MPPLAYSQSRNQYAPIAERGHYILSGTQSQFPEKFALYADAIVAHQSDLEALQSQARRYGARLVDHPKLAQLKPGRFELHNK